MKMPIVSMNKMAMNESVATTCCYREVPTASVIYWEVLHGGWIGNGYTEELALSDAYKDLDKTIWVGSAPYDFYATKSANAHTVEQALLDSTAMYTESNNGKGWMFEYLNYGLENAFSFATRISDGNSKIGVSVAACDHKTVDCAYKETNIGYRHDYHFDATSKHGSAADWANGHAAKQFSS